MELHRSAIRVTIAMSALTALLTSSSSLVAATIPGVDTTVVPPIVHRVTSDGPGHLLTTGPGLDGFLDLIVTREGNVVLASVNDDREIEDGFDTWPMRAWTLGQPGFTEIDIPTGPGGLAEGPGGSLYLAGEGRFLARLADGAWEVLAPQRDTAAYRDHVVADDGTVYAAFGKVLYVFDGHGWSSSDFDDRGKRVANLERTADGDIWLHVADRLLRRDGGRWVEMQPTGGDGTVRVLAIDADPEGRLWAVLDNGVGACQPVTIPIDLLRWAPGGGDAGKKDRRCTFGGELITGSSGDAWSIEERSLRNLTDSTGSLSVGGPHIELVAADGDDRIWILAPDDGPTTSDLYVIETGSGS